MQANISAVIAKFAEDLEVAIREDLISRLSLTSPTPQPSARSVRTPKLAKGQKRSPEALEQLTRDLAKRIGSKPGLRIEHIAEAMGCSTKELALPVQKLLGNGTIKKRGQKRATTYYAK